MVTPCSRIPWPIKQNEEDLYVMLWSDLQDILLSKKRKEQNSCLLYKKVKYEHTTSYLYLKKN